MTTVAPALDRSWSAGPPADDAPSAATVAPPSPPTPRSAFVAALLLIGLFFPTSSGGVISTPRVVAHLVVLILLVVADWGWRHRRVAVARTWGAAAIIAAVGGATFLSPFADLAAGALAPYSAMAITLWASVRAYRAAEWVRRLLALTSIVVVACGALIVTGSGPARDLLVAHYSIAYADLVANMTLWRKPVFTFGSHSVAAVCYYLLFYLNFETYRAQRRRLHLVLAVALVLVGLFLTSMTAGVLMALAGAQILWAGRGNRIVPLVALAALGVAGAYVLATLEQNVALAEGLRLAFSVDDGGLRSRYASGGALVGNIAFIMSYPFQPIGLSFSSTVFYGDSGPVEYLLRGSIVLLLAVYGMLFAALRTNLHVRRHAWHLFILVLLAEVGFTVLTFGRFLYLLLFAVIYLNTFGRARGAWAATSA